ncbi:MAG TPA: N-methyl-L-tryptophan oxidase [Pirellulaceae bacterium]|nr:N-methyl-L-tryptophan oxidase [Pirellulaceae bacterium]
MPTYDAIVLGAGGVGTAAMFHLARRGQRVLGIDRFSPGHDRGSSHGESRIIRQAYFEHPNYVPLLRTAYELWHEVETLTRQQLLFPVGLLQIGPPDGVVIPGVIRSAMRHRLKIEELTLREVDQRFPAFHVPPGCTAVFEPQAGYLLVEECVRAHAELARQQGAELHCDEHVVAWSVSGSGVEVRTDRAVYSAGRLIITAGAWAGELLGELGIPLRVLRKHLYWYATTGTAFSAARRAPTFLYELPHGIFYGFPELHAGEIKLGEHSGGSVVSDPSHDDRQPEMHDRQRVDAFVTDCLAQATNVVRQATCFYTMSPDEHFIVDQYPAAAQVVFAAGLSGHGFKFVPVLGQLLADLALDGRSALPAEFLIARRFR